MTVAEDVMSEQSGTELTERRIELITGESIEIDVEIGAGRLEIGLTPDAGPTGDAPAGPAGPAEPQDAGPTDPIADDGGEPGGDGAHDATPQPEDGAGAGNTGAGNTGAGNTGAGDDGRPPGTTVVIVRPARGRGHGFLSGLSGLLNLFGTEAGSGMAAEAVRQSRVELSGRRLLIRGPHPLPLRTVPLEVIVRGPAGSSVRLRTGSADVDVTGVAHSVDIATGSGEVAVQHTDRDAEVRNGSGLVRLGVVGGRLRVRSGSGGVDVGTLGSTGVVTTGSGDVRFGTVSNDTAARTGSGDLLVADAAGGDLDLVTGSGDLRLGIRSGVPALLDVVSGSGEATSDLPVGGPAPPPGRPVLRIRARTGSGRAHVTQSRG
jgi:hypothetical protein